MDSVDNDMYMHDVDLCIDIDINSDFMNMPVKHYKMNPIIKGANPELIMVVFIMVLLITMMATITLAHYLIERPKKRHLLSALRGFIKEHGLDEDLKVIHAPIMALNEKVIYFVTFKPKIYPDPYFIEFFFLFKIVIYENFKNNTEIFLRD